MCSLLLNYLKTNYICKCITILLYFLKTILGRINCNDFWRLTENKWHQPRISLSKTLYINFRCCKLSIARIFPIYVYSGTEIISTRGLITFENDVSSGIIKWGYNYGFREYGKTKIRIDGHIHFHGRAMFSASSNVYIFETGTFIVGDDFKIWENCMLYCLKKIEIGKHASITFQTSIMDTDFHYTINLENRTIKPRSREIKIGDYVWIGNRTTIKKGTIVPNYTIVAGAYSVLSKDYTEIPPFSIIGGVPAKVLASNIVRTWADESNLIIYLDKWFTENPSQKEYIIEEKEQIEKYYLNE